MKKFLEKIKEFEKLRKYDIEDDSREYRTESRLSDSKDVFYDSQVNCTLEQRKLSESSKIYQKLDYEDVKKYPKIKNYINIISYLVTNDFSVTMIGIEEDEFEIQLINNTEGSIFEVNKYELVFLFFTVACKNNDVQLSFDELFVEKELNRLINLDAYSYILVNKYDIVESKFKCVYYGLNNTIKTISIKLQELIRIMFFEKEYIEKGLIVPKEFNNKSLYEIIFYNKFKFLYTLDEIVDDLFKIELPVNIDELEDYNPITKISEELLENDNLQALLEK